MIEPVGPDGLTENARRLLVAIHEAFGGEPFTKDDIQNSDHPSLRDYRAWLEAQIAIEDAAK